MIANDFKFNGKRLSDFGLMMSDPDENQDYPSKKIEYGDISHARPIPNHFASKYSDLLVLHMMIVKDLCLSDEPNSPEFTRKELNDIISWLTKPEEYEELILDTDDDSLQVVYYGNFEVNPVTIADVCFGLKLTFTCNAPYAFSNIQTASTIISGDTSGMIAISAPDTLESEIKPTIIIESIDGNFFGETITLVNLSDANHLMSIVLPESTNRLSIDCGSKTITNELGDTILLSDLGITVPQYDEYNFISANSFLINWLSIFPGFNNITLTFDQNVSNYKVSIISQFPIKAGGF